MEHDIDNPGGGGGGGGILFGNKDIGGAEMSLPPRRKSGSQTV